MFCEIGEAMNSGSMAYQSSWHPEHGIMEIQDEKCSMMHILKSLP